jgi:hypothetical protein
LRLLSGGFELSGGVRHESGEEVWLVKSYEGEATEERSEVSMIGGKWLT